MKIIYQELLDKNIIEFMEKDCKEDLLPVLGQKFDIIHMGFAVSVAQA